MTVYVHSFNHKIISEKKAYEMMSSTAAQYLKNSEILEEFLGSFYTASELFYFNEAERDEAMKKYADYCHEIALDEFDEVWKAVEVEE